MKIKQNPYGWVIPTKAQLEKESPIIGWKVLPDNKMFNNELKAYSFACGFEVSKASINYAKILLSKGKRTVKPVREYETKQNSPTKKP